MKISTLLWCATVVAACANVAPPNPAEAERLSTARTLLAQDPHAACRIADELLADNDALREARLLRADGSIRIAASDPRNRGSLLLDAVSDLQKAVQGMADDAAAPALRQLAECQYELGEFEAGSDAGTRAAAAYAALETPSARRDAAAAMLVAARCDLRLFTAARQAEIDGGTKDALGRVPIGSDTARLATNAAARFAGARSTFPGESVVSTALLHRWLGQTSEVGAEYERGLRDFPEEVAIHDAYIQWMLDSGQQRALLGSYSLLVRANPGVTALRWHQGRALYRCADLAREQGDFAAAKNGYAKSDAVFAEYGAMAPQNRDGANQWRALCDLASAKVSLTMGDPVSAGTELLRAADRSAATTTYQNGAPVLHDSFGEHFTGVLFAIHRTLNETADDALAATLAWNERVLQRFPDRFGFVYNNAALAARDLGTRKANDGDVAAAKQLWERSFAHYEKALALSPNDPRIVNDCGLMLLYHLERDYDRARNLFDRAIELGEKQLRALAADAPRAEREHVEEAIGDAYQNIAVLMRTRLGQPFASYAPFCEQSVRYYPYERREAAALLRSQGRDDVASTARAGGAAPTPASQGGAAEALEKQRARIEQKVADENLDGALVVLDELSKECREHAPYHALRGDLTLRLARQAAAEQRKGTELLFQEAVAALVRAVELDPEPVAPRLLLAQAQFESNKAEDAIASATRLLLHMQSQGGGKPEDLLALHTLRARAAGAVYAQKKGAGTEDKELLDAARASYRYLDDKGALDAAQRTAWSTTEEWAGAGAEATNVFLRGIQKKPDDQALLEAVITVGYRTQQLPAVVAALAKGDDAVTLWYLGKARFWLADQEGAAKKLAEAQATLDQAKAAFVASMQRNPGFRNSSEQWIAMVTGKKGYLAFLAKDHTNAEKWLLEAAKARPDQIGAEIGSHTFANGTTVPLTTKLGVMLLAETFGQDLGKLEALYRAAAEAANSDVDLLNNAALFARDHGEALAKKGQKEQATELYERSYRTYERAVQLAPTDLAKLDQAMLSVRLRNDLALMAIQYVGRDWESSRRLLDSAIADGDRALADNNPTNDYEKQLREQLGIAVGDCHENVALWHLRHSQDFAAAKAAAEKSLTYPGPRGGARAHLREAERKLQGK